ncbi:ArsR family transcriptional regulator [Escherichia coli]|nr:ArsR family transcriptional regulator [Escherichia coli]
MLVVLPGEHPLQPGLVGYQRMSVLLCLSGEANVTELEAAVGITQPTLSQQLGVMRRLKLVETRRAGKMVYYRIGDNRIMTLLNTLYDLYCPQSDPDKVKKQP